MENYFTQPQPGFGGVSWTMGVVWVLGLVVGIYLFTQWQDPNPLRLRFGRRVGLATAILSLLGIFALVFKFMEIPRLEWRVWSYLLAFATLGLWGWAIYFWVKRLPALVASTRSSRSTRATSQRKERTAQPNGSASETQTHRQPRPEATTTRREARRERKRRSR